MYHTIWDRAQLNSQLSQVMQSHLEDVLAQLAQFWIERGWSLAAIARAMRNVGSGLELMRRIDGAPQ
jgi:hypothetical protein